jgi:hypothetical protein
MQVPMQPVLHQETIMHSNEPGQMLRTLDHQPVLNTGLQFAVQLLLLAHVCFLFEDSISVSTQQNPLQRIASIKLY